MLGYAGKVLRVDLTTGNMKPEVSNEATLRNYIGGVCLGVNILYNEVPPEVGWSDPENRIFIGSGPLGGTKVAGSGTIAVVSKGALTNGVASSQANGSFGTYLRLSAFDGIILQGAAPSWVYLYIHNGLAELIDASHLVGKDTFDTVCSIKEELGKKQISVLCIGPAGENLVRFACISADEGHMAAHNGLGAVMGSKKLKAIVVERGKATISLADSQGLSALAKQMRKEVEIDKRYKTALTWGTSASYVNRFNNHTLPVKNYTTGIFTIDNDRLERYTPQIMRQEFKAKLAPCWACPSHHSCMMEIPDGKYAGRIVDGPEYEGLAAWSSLVDVKDVVETMVLANDVDRLGIDTNEAGWVIAWLLECYEKGIVTRSDTDGLEMTWGNSDAIMAMLHKIARREGFGNVLAEGVMRAAQHVGGEAPNLAIHTLKGNTPRGHDHRLIWPELFDTCVSNTGTLETHILAPYDELGLDAGFDRFNPEQVSTIEAKIKGAMMFEDSLVACRYCTRTALGYMSQAVNLATGWDLDANEVMSIGRRSVNLMRVYNLRSGISPKLDAPSVRYGSTPIDGPMAGKGIMPYWNSMLLNYYKHMGWNEKGIPTRETLGALGLEGIYTDLDRIDI